MSEAGKLISSLVRMLVEEDVLPSDFQNMMKDYPLQDAVSLPNPLKRLLEEAQISKDLSSKAVAVLINNAPSGIKDDASLHEVVAAYVLREFVSEKGLGAADRVVANAAFEVAWDELDKSNSLGITSIDNVAQFVKHTTAQKVQELKIAAQVGHHNGGGLAN